MADSSSTSTTRTPLNGSFETIWTSKLYRSPTDLRDGRRKERLSKHTLRKYLGIVRSGPGGAGRTECSSHASKRRIRGLCQPKIWHFDQVSMLTPRGSQRNASRLNTVELHYSEHLHMLCRQSPHCRQTSRQTHLWCHPYRLNCSSLTLQSKPGPQLLASGPSGNGYSQNATGSKESRLCWTRTRIHQG